MLRTTEKILFIPSHFPTAHVFGDFQIVGEEAPDGVDAIRR